MTYRPWSMGSRAALITACLLVCVGAGSCVLGNDSERPVLSVDPIWDASSGDRFIGQTCEGAGVALMRWEIQDEKGKTLKEADDLEECKPLDFVGLDRGTYQVVLEGYDKEEVKRWENTCTDLELGRFDVLYGCMVDQLPEDETEDAGVPDAGD